MARACSICTHPKRAEIELSVTNGASIRDIALQFSVGHMSIQRHMAEHIKQEVKQQQQAKELAKTIDCLKQLIEVNAVTRAILTRNFAAKQDELVLKAADRILKQLELAAKLQGDLDESPTIDISIHPEFVTLQNRIVSALDRCPPDIKLMLLEAISPEEEFRAHLN